MTVNERLVREDHHFAGETWMEFATALMWVFTEKATVLLEPDPEKG